MVQGMDDMLDTAYIYLTVDELCAGALIHLISGVDEDCQGSTGGAIVTAITGYTEWVSHGGPVLTIGWDWQMAGSGKVVSLQRVGAPSSNLMLQSPCRRDLGHARTVELLKAYVDSFDWQHATLGHISARYGD
jgi:hypothetical protein